MSTVLDRLPSGARITIIRLRSLGDCVLTTPAVHVLKSARPDLRVSVVVENAFAPVFEGNPDIETIAPPGFPQIAELHPDLVLNLHGGTRSAQLTLACRARLRAGFEHFRFRQIYNVRIPRAQEIFGVQRKVHTAEHLASAMFYLGVPQCEIPRARLFASEAPASRSYVVLHPVASGADKAWPAENFAAVGAHLKREGVEPVFIGAAGDDFSRFAAFRTVTGAPLGEIKSLLAGASMFIGNDSGPAHMAAAFGIPSVVLFGPSDHDVWAPWRTDAVVLRSADIREIRIEEVTGALAGLLV